jgi:hypothetical protein
MSTWSGAEGRQVRRHGGTEARRTGSWSDGGVMGGGMGLGTSSVHDDRLVEELGAATKCSPTSMPPMARRQLCAQAARRSCKALR